MCSQNYAAEGSRAIMVVEKLNDELDKRYLRITDLFHEIDVSGDGKLLWNRERLPRDAQKAKRLIDLLYAERGMLLRIKWLRVLVEQDVSGQFCLWCVRGIFHGSLRLI